MAWRRVPGGDWIQWKCRSSREVRRWGNGRKGARSFLERLSAAMIAAGKPLRQGWYLGKEAVSGGHRCADHHASSEGRRVFLPVRRPGRDTGREMRGFGGGAGGVETCKAGQCPPRFQISDFGCHGAYAGIRAKPETNSSKPDQQDRQSIDDWVTGVTKLRSTTGGW